VKQVELASTLKENEKIFEDIFKNVAEKRKKYFKDFPWIYLNSTKYSSVSSPHTGKYFIDAQIYLGVENGAGETIYIFQEVGIRKPNWSKIFYDQIEKHRESEKSLNKWFEVAEFNKEAKGALAIIKKEIDEEERYFAITFGWTGRFLLNLDYCDNNFGKHYAYNLLSSNPNYKAQSFAEINLNEKKLKSEQAKPNGRVNVLRGIRAFIPKSLVVTDGRRQICSFTGSHITVNTKFAFETIGDRCKDFFQIAQEKYYKKDYKHIDDFRSLEQEEEINEILIKAFENCYFEVPFEVERITGTQSLQDLRLKYKGKGGLSKNFPKLKPNYHDFFHLAKDLKEFVMSSKINLVDKVDRLRRLKIIAHNDSSHQVASWNAHQLITATVDYRNTTYWIEGGEVFEVHENFVQWINSTLDKYYEDQEIPSNSGIHKLLETPFTDSHRQKRKNKTTGKVYKVLSEGVYNKSIAANNPKEFILFDAKLIPVKGDANTHSTVEPCDLFSNTGELIHLKRCENSSTGISYLATQAMSSASLLIHHQDFHNCFIKKLTDKNFQEAKQKVIERKFKVVLGYIHPEQVSPSGLPFNAKMQLLKGIEEIQSLGLKFNIISIRDDSSSKQGSSSSSSSSTQSTVPYTQQSSLDFVEDKEAFESGLEGTGPTGEVDFDEEAESRSDEDKGGIPWPSLASQNEIKGKNEEDEIAVIVNQFYSGELPKSMQRGMYKQLLENYENTSQEFESLKSQLCEFYELDKNIEPKDLLEKIKSLFDDFDPESSETHEKNYENLSQLYEKIKELEGEIYNFCFDQFQNQRDKPSSKKGKEKLSDR
jgi:uncharacterized protein (TIGR04141 family)